MIEADVAIVGAGMAGASLAFELSRLPLRAVLLEREAQPGYHTTGRSAALFAPLYGNAPVRALTRASEAFLSAPPAGFADVPLLRPRGALFYADRERLPALERFVDELAAGGLAAGAPPRRLDAAATWERMPVLRRDRPRAVRADGGEVRIVAGGLLDDTAADMDVHAILTGYLRLAKAAGVSLLSRFDLAEADIARDAGGWRIAERDGLRRTVRAARLAICAGAWADPIARLAPLAAAGVRPPGIGPRRRTALTVALATDGPALAADAPAAIAIEEDVYFKPESGHLLLSPADETPSPPVDAQPDEIDVAVAIDRLQRDTVLQVRRIVSRWAGLRSFAPDRAPVAGFDPADASVFWLVGQGGYGIQMAPALAAFAAARLGGRGIPAHVADEGLDAAAVAPGRPMLVGGD